jgi:hypothetical protein
MARKSDVVSSGVRFRTIGSNQSATIERLFRGPHLIEVDATGLKPRRRLV